MTGRLISYTLHPDERTIFVSTIRRGTAASFAFDTAEHTERAYSEWKRQGNWMLPFIGRAHFDHELDALVGLSGDPNTLGYVCACDMVSASPGTSDRGCPSWKLSKEKLFGEDPVEKHVGATLVYMGGGSKFCLVQCISIEYGCVDDRNPLNELEEKDAPRLCRRLFRLATFSLKYDKNGDLTIGNSRRVRYYKVPEACTEFPNNSVAFWL